MSYKIVIPGSLPSLNELLAAERATTRGGRGHSPGNDMKKAAEMVIISAIRRQCPRARPKPPVFIHYVFFEKNRKRDLDNISAVAHKFIQDSLVKAGILKNDGWAYIRGFDDRFEVDKIRPRIEIVIEEN